MAQEGKFTRRGLLKSAGVIGCSLAAHPLLTPMTFASAPGDARLVVIILRGGMDGLDVLQPIGDRTFATVRPSLRGEAEQLTDFYALHTGMAGLRPLWDAGELAFVQAVSTPYRDKRSHFDGQDMLEAGTGGDVIMTDERDGWLNRLVSVLPGVTGQTAYAVGRDNMRILAGDAPAAHWAPQTNLAISPQARLLLERIYESDPLFHAAASQAMDLAETLAEEAEEDAATGTDMMAQPRQGRNERRLAAFAADRLRRDTRIAAFSITGWDTHRSQRWQMASTLTRLSAAIETLKADLGPVWGNTTVLALTEFGRTVRQNGTEGTDHGTGGMVVAAGGAIRGRQVLGDWPGLMEADLYDRRDLMPTRDVRAYAGWALRDLFGIETSVIEQAIFPGLDLGPDPRLIA